jgi:metal-responsive CopG/Arc/MetJ family transcriptional regulator
MLVQSDVTSTMAQSQKNVRQSVSLPSAVARRVQALAKRGRTSANRVIIDLIESGLEAKDREKIAFFDLAERLAHTSDRAEQKRLKEELARMTFGEP